MYIFLLQSLKGFESFLGEVQSTNTLERVRIVDVEFENPDGSEVILDTDLLGNQRKGKKRVLYDQSLHYKQEKTI